MSILSKRLLVLAAFYTGSFLFLLAFFPPHPAGNACAWWVFLSAAGLPAAAYWGIRYSFSNRSWGGYGKSLLLPFTALLLVYAGSVVVQQVWRIGLDTGALFLSFYIAACAAVFLLAAIINTGITLYFLRNKSRLGFWLDVVLKQAAYIGLGTIAWVNFEQAVIEDLPYIGKLNEGVLVVAPPILFGLTFVYYYTRYRLAKVGK